MKHVLLGLAACAATLSISAQSFQCGTDRMRAERIANDPTYLEREARYNEEIARLIRDNAEMRGRDVVVTIPIVFHILNLGGDENITNEQILNQVELLNQDFRALNADIGDIHPAFDPLVGDAMVQFALPTRDPNGDCTNGIDRVRTPETNRGDDRSKMNPWPRDRYLNVWTARSMREGTAGYAYYPGAFDGPTERLADGIIILNQYIGEIGTANPYRSTALSHEIGHYLNLPHVWGNNNGVEPGAEQAPEGHMVPDCGDDGVEDTPPTRGWDICPEYDHPVFGWGTDCNAFDLEPFVYDFADVTTGSGTADPTPLENPTDTFLNVPRERAQMLPFSASGVAGNSSSNGKFDFAGWDDAPVDGEAEYSFLPGTINTSKYYEFTMQANLTDLLYIDSIGFKVARNTNGVRTFAVRSNVNDYSSNLPIRTGGNPNITLQSGNVAFITGDVELNDITVYVDPPISSAGYFYTDEPVTFRLYAWNAESANGVARVCANSTPIDLFDRLGGAPQPGGTWSGPSATNGSFDPATMAEGTYTYTLDAGFPCPTYSASVNVTIIGAPAVPTISGNNALCTGASVTLTSSSTTNNKWSTGQTTPTISLNAANTVTVTVTQNGCSSTSEPFSVSATAPNVAGVSQSLSVCNSSPAVGLFISLGGAPQTGGTWSGPSEVVDGLYDPATMNPGAYVYTLAANGPCASASATINVQEIATASAGTNGAMSVCSNAPPADLLDGLAGAPQDGGTWTGPSATSGQYDPATMTPGTYTYTIDLGGSCGSATANVVVSEPNAPPVPTISGNNAFCEGGNTVLTSSSGSANLWSPGNAATPSITVSAGGTYTVKVSTGSCSSTSQPFTVSVQTRVNAGGDAEMTACDASSNIDLFTALIGSPMAGGTWTGPSEVVDGFYQPSSMEPGIYTYTVSGTAPCPNDEAIVKVTEAQTFDFAPGTFGVDDVTVFGSTNLIENVENYMEYSYCSKMFTVGQRDRMRAALNSATGQRNNLWTDENLRITGVAEGFRAVCPPEADFYLRTVPIGTIGETQSVPILPTVCVGTEVQFVDNSVRAFPDSWSWTFQDGNPSTSTDRNPLVSFTSPGWKTVSLTVTNAHGSDTRTTPYGILVTGDPNDITGPWQESFETNPDLYPWVEANHASNVTYFQRTTAAAYSGQACAVLNSGTRNFLDLIDPTNGQDIDELISPSFNLDALTSGTFSFRYAYATTTGDLALVTEKLVVSISTDCGETWVTLPGGELEGEELINNGNNPQLPPPAWTLASFNLSPSRLVPNVRFKFTYTSSDFSGNLYIDDINVGGPVGIADLTPENFMSLYPNPTNDRFTLGVHAMDRFPTEVTITDLRGAVVFSTVHRPAGLNGMEFSGKELGLAEGVYMINASNEAGRSTQKLMVGH